MKPDVQSIPLPATPLATVSESCALFVSSYPQFGSLAHHPTFSQQVHGEQRRQLCDDATREAGLQGVHYLPYSFSQLPLS
eukprot:149573-Pleurochrysis_carterae.AAC.2